MKTVSIVIPVYNVVRFLPEAIESARAQTYESIEVVVVDDGSTEPVKEIVGRFAGVKLVRQEHAGVSAARNLGSEAASGEYLSFLDADDTWVPEKLSSQMKLISSEIDIVFPRYLNFVDPGSERPAHIKDEDLVKPSPCITGMLISKADFFRVGPFNVAYNHGEDTEWLLRSKEVGLRSVTQEEASINRRLHGSNLSSNVTQSRSNAFDMLRASIARKRAAKG